MLKAFMIMILFSAAIGALLARQEVSVWSVLIFIMASVLTTQTSYVVTLLLTNHIW
jgi:uncharacterized membrane protein YcaP (DUF421 family)